MASCVEEILLNVILMVFCLVLCENGMLFHEENILEFF
jgi:hypothetical protein